MRIRRAETMKLFIGTLLMRPYVFAFLAAFLGAGAADLGWRRTLLFGGCVWPVVWVAEFASTRIGVPFGLYHYTGLTRGQELYIADVPFMDSVSFLFLAYAAFCLARTVAGRRRWPPLALAPLTGLLMMLLDVVIDPAAVRGDQWFLGRIFSYPDGGVYFGVPLSNFAGWWIVGTIAVGAYLALAGEATGSARLWPGVALYYAVLAFNLAVTAWIGEWELFGAGVGVHAALAGGLSLADRRSILPIRPRRPRAYRHAGRGVQLGAPRKVSGRNVTSASTERP
jgi:putative membrane protein